MSGTSAPPVVTNSTSGAIQVVPLAACRRPTATLVLTDSCARWVQGTNGVQLDALLGIQLTAKCMVAFLKRHLPLSPSQRGMLEAAASGSSQAPASAKKSAKAESPAKGMASPAKGDGSGRIVAEVQAAVEGQRQAPARLGNADVAEMQALLRGHLFKAELAS